MNFCYRHEHLFDYSTNISFPNNNFSKNRFSVSVGIFQKDYFFPDLFEVRAYSNVTGFSPEANVSIAASGTFFNIKLSLLHRSDHNFLTYVQTFATNF